MNAVGAARNTSGEELGEQLKSSSIVVLRTVNRSRGGGNTFVIIGVGDRLKKPSKSISSMKTPSPKKRSAEDTYFDREMCRFSWV